MTEEQKTKNHYEMLNNSSNKALVDLIKMQDNKIEQLEKENAELKKKLKEELKTIADKDLSFVARFDALEKENADLKGEANSVLDNWCRGDDPCPHLKKRDEQLTKAKEIIENFLKEFERMDVLCNYQLRKEAEQFISEVEK